MQLTPSQKNAVRHGGNNLQLIACAGSGKTEGRGSPCRALAGPDECNPSFVPANSIAFTFTDKTTAELKERIVTRTAYQ